MKQPNGLRDLIENMSEEEAQILWKCNGYEAEFPGRVRAILYMVQGVTRRALRSLAEFFASLAPHSGAVALAALLRILTIRPAGIALPAPAPRSMSPQRRCHRLTPARAP